MGLLYSPRDKDGLRIRCRLELSGNAEIMYADGREGKTMIELTEEQRRTLAKS